MESTHGCPICTDTYEEQTRLHVHLEVEHRKSELVTYLVRNHTRSSDPMVESEEEAENRPTPPL